MALTAEHQLTNLFDSLDIQGASLPYWPEMLDFDLDENKSYERAEIEAYLDTFPVRDKA